MAELVWLGVRLVVHVIALGGAALALGLLGVWIAALVSS